MMKLRQFGRTQRVLLSLLGVCAFVVGCKDDEPCDAGEIVKNAQCYPASAATGGEGGGTDAGTGPDAAAGAPSAQPDTPFGSPCTDTVASSDCAGIAPVCADLTLLGQTVMCTQISCGAGEQNAGVCPTSFNCFATPGYPSVCIKN